MQVMIDPKELAPIIAATVSATLAQIEADELTEASYVDPRQSVEADERPDATVNKICLYLEVAGPSTIRSIAEGTERTYQAVYLQLKNKPELFRKLPDNTWAINKR